MTNYLTFTAEQVDEAAEYMASCMFHGGFMMRRELGDPVDEAPMTPGTFRAESLSRSRIGTGPLSALHRRLALYGLGLAGEAGEVADEVKKILFHDKPLDRDHLLNECGDVLWYVDRVLHAIDATLGDAMAANVAKLAARYPDGFDAAAKKHGFGDAS